MHFLYQALYDYQPSVNDNNPSQAWISTMEKAYVNLARYECELMIYRSWSANAVNLEKIYCSSFHYAWKWFW